MAEQKRPQAVWEPGTLDATRKNIGSLDAAEAVRMQKILGGQIMTEKSTSAVEASYSKLQRRSSNNRVVGAAGRSGARTQSGQNSAQKNREQQIAPQNKTASLPAISASDNKKIDGVMMASPFCIKPNYGIFNFVKLFQKNGTERIIPEFVSVTLNAHLEHIESFINLVKTFVRSAPNVYQSSIQNEQDLKFRFVRKICEWSVREIKVALADLNSVKREIFVADLIPFVKAVYRQLITVFYLTEQVVNNLIKELYSDVVHLPNVEKSKFAGVAKSAAGEWQYLYRRILRGLYPLLMRMCGTPFVEFPLFFSTQVSAVLNFLGIKKYDLVLQQKRADPNEVRNAKEGQEKTKQEEEAQKKAQAQKEENMRAEKLQTGLALLDRLFPGAGFKNLENFPDMWPYFNPLYGFDEAFLMLAPENPLQITIALCEILQDFFHACSKMNFSVNDNSDLIYGEDTIRKALNDWPVYVDTLFTKDYGDPLKQLVNQLYTSSDYVQTQGGRKNINDIFWQTKYAFLPYFAFQQLVLERPINSGKYLPLFSRVSFLRNAFENLSQQVSNKEQSKGNVSGLENPWEHYEFEIVSPISRRMDVLLNAKEYGAKMTATNANLIKYIECALAVLDWWVNSKESPAYKADSTKIYRTMPGTNEPAFSVEARDDQDRLFAQAVRAAMQKKAAPSAPAQ